MNVRRVLAVLPILLAVQASAATPAPRAISSPHVIFLNRSGGTYTPGQDDSSNNVSSIVSGSSSIPAFAGNDNAWTDLLLCVRSMFARFDVTVTDVDPGDAAHLEAVIGGIPQNVGLPPGVSGIAPFACAAVDRSIVFVFSDLIGSDATSLCEVTAGQIAHSYGVDTEYYCPDITSYLSGCGAKSFQDHDAPCGELAARPCMCGGSTQNSAQILLGVLGAFCDTADCDDGDACTIDTCDPVARCGSSPQQGFSGADCELSKLLVPDLCGSDSLGSRAKVVKRAVGKIQRLIGLAANAPKPAKARKRVAATQRTLTALRKKIDAAAQHGKITENCAATVDRDLATLQTVLGGLPM